MAEETRPLYASLRRDDEVVEPYHLPHMAPHTGVWPLFRTHPHCTGACQQGRKPCTAPDACLQQDDDDRDETAGMGAIVVPVVVVSVAALASLVIVTFRNL